MKNKIIFDIETTGLDPSKDKIIQISAVKFDTKFNVINDFDKFIKVDFELSEFTKNLTHITDETLALNGVSENQAFDEFNEFIKDADVLMGHNVKKFDLNFIQKHVDYTKFSILDTLELSRRYSKTNKHSMNHLIQFYNIDNCGNEHNALNDCYYELELFKKILLQRNRK